MVPEGPCSEHVPNIVFRTCSERPGFLFPPKRALTGCPQDLKYEEFDIFRNCLHFSFSKTTILKIAKSTISMHPKIQIPRIGENLGNMFRTCSEHLVRNSVPSQLRSFLKLRIHGVQGLGFRCQISRDPNVTLNPKP